jgi:hypothetical protein
MSKYAAKHAGLSSDFLGAMIHALRIAEKQLSKSGSSKEKVDVSRGEPNRSQRGKRKPLPSSSDKRGKKPCVKSSLGKDYPSKREPTSVKKKVTPKVTTFEKKALRRELSKKSDFKTSNDPRNRKAGMSASRSDPGLIRVPRGIDRALEKEADRQEVIKTLSRAERRKKAGLTWMYKHHLEKDYASLQNPEKAMAKDKLYMQERRARSKRLNASVYASVLPATECGLLKRGASVYSHYTWTVDSKGSALKVKRDYGKAVEGLDLTKVGVKGSRVHCGVLTGKCKAQISDPAARMASQSEKKAEDLKEKIAFASADPIEKLVAKMRKSDRIEFGNILHEGGAKFDDSDKARITIGTLKKGFAYGRRIMLRAAMSKAVRNVETSRNVMSTEKWTLLNKEEYSALQRECIWRKHPFDQYSHPNDTLHGKPWRPYRREWIDWASVARSHIDKNKSWKDVTSDLEKENDDIYKREMAKSESDRQRFLLPGGDSRPVTYHSMVDPASLR